MVTKGVDVLSMFRLLTAYFYQPESDKDKSIEIAELIFQTNGGISLHDKDEIQMCPARLTHVFVNDNSLDQESLRKKMQFLDINIHAVTIMNCQWIHDCHLLNTRICEKSYKIVLN